MFDTEVLVVGGGPVGEMLLVQLAARGVSAIGFEKDEVVWPKPRAVHFDSETLRTFQALGLGETVAALCEPMGDYRFENEEGEVLIQFPSDRLGDQGWLDSYMFHQPEIDDLLRARIEASPDVRLVNGATVVALEQDEHSVTCVVRAVDGVETTYRARYLIGCDGASSFVRRTIGSTFEDLGGNDPWLIVDGQLNDDAPIAGSMVLFGHYTRPKIWGRMPGNRGRMELKMLVTDDRETIADPARLPELTRGVLTAENFDVVRSAVYVFRACIVDSWRRGRVFLAGDAAHLAPPLFGQGLCAGIRDTVNLAWKLDYVLNGADPRLLDSYETERSVHARAWIEQSRAMAENLATTDPDVAMHRDAFLRENPGVGAPHSPALGDGLHGRSEGVVGMLALQPIVDGRRFDDAVGSAFVIAATTGLVATLSESDHTAIAAAVGRVVLLTDEHEGVTELLAYEGASAVVVRPDRYVFGVADTPDDFVALCRRVMQISAPPVRAAA